MQMIAANLFEIFFCEDFFKNIFTKVFFKNKKVIHTECLKKIFLLHSMQ